MYRDYEDPRAIGRALQERKADFRRALENGADDDTLHSIHEDIEELMERLNFAWQDDEHNEEVSIWDIG